jgi:hypothetical protein
VRFAEKGDQPSVKEAISAVQPIAGGQPEILADLERTPPDLGDADQRLSALLAALRSRADTANPALAQSALDHVLAMPRYAQAAQGPPWWQRALIWLLQQIGRLLSSLGAGRLVIPAPVWLGAALLVLFVVVALLVRSALSRAANDRARRQPGSGYAPSVDFFSIADGYAAEGDYTRAVRALAGGVAMALSGQHAWDSSPLTVRELFQRAPDPQRLRPLLLPFEAAVYGHRLPDAQSYGRAVEAAAPFRRAAA